MKHKERYTVYNKGVWPEEADHFDQVDEFLGWKSHFTLWCGVKFWFINLPAFEAMRRDSCIAYGVVWSSAPLCRAQEARRTTLESESRRAAWVNPVDLDSICHCHNWLVFVGMDFLHVFLCSLLVQGMNCNDLPLRQIFFVWMARPSTDQHVFLHSKMQFWHSQVGNRRIAESTERTARDHRCCR